MLPPQSAMVIGPCPMCSDYVAVFCGFALPLEREIFTTGSAQQKRDHLMEVIVDFLKGRVQEAIKDDNGAPDELPEMMSELEDSLQESSEEIRPDDREILGAEPVISEDELEHFRKNELNLIDNKDYFRAIFE